MRMKAAKDDTAFNSSGKFFTKLHRVPCHNLSAAALPAVFWICKLLNLKTTTLLVRTSLISGSEAHWNESKGAIHKTIPFQMGFRTKCTDACQWASHCSASLSGVLRCNSLLQFSNAHQFQTGPLSFLYPTFSLYSFM